ncbi:hypothetical protein OKJ48_44075 [Streptomyces kunmingensis]|uniref:Uncharacterized protein n=1 Tax=Streptomyces kunmingensis TaxID=68225 RepID=A0ABU6CQZ6_9ACTN|nr:hypothetical protein [Streptomyces kunmingensis]MEB3967166.1 hypothetical protein [Streptomyces kunmingensis]
MTGNEEISLSGERVRLPGHPSPEVREYFRNLPTLQRCGSTAQHQVLLDVHDIAMDVARVLPRHAGWGVRLAELEAMADSAHSLGEALRAVRLAGRMLSEAIVEAEAVWKVPDQPSSPRRFGWCEASADRDQASAF